MPPGTRFNPLMVLYLTDETTAEDIRAAKAGGLVVAAKLYPAGATTNSAHGVTSIDRIYPALEAFLGQEREETTGIAEGYKMLEAIVAEAGAAD